MNPVSERLRATTLRPKRTFSPLPSSFAGLSKPGSTFGSPLESRWSASFVRARPEMT